MEPSTPVLDRCWMIRHPPTPFFILALFIGNASSSYLSIPNLARSCAQGPCSVAQSTYFTNSNCSASNTVNNDLFDSVCTCPGGRWCSDSDPWIQIDLVVSQLVFAGRVWDQQSSVAEVRQASALDGFKIWVGDSLPYNAGGNVQCYIAATQQHLIYPYMHSFLCGSSGRYVFFQPTAIISPSTNPSANFSEIQLYPSMPNVARACSGGPCPVLQSSYYTASSLCDASHANDGDPNSFVCTCTGGGYCTDEDPWLRIDLQQRTPIFAGIITNRAWSGPSRMENFRIWVGDGGTTYNSSGNIRCASSSKSDILSRQKEPIFRTIAPAGPTGAPELEMGNLISETAGATWRRSPRISWRRTRTPSSVMRPVATSFFSRWPSLLGTPGVGE